jgi:hypothetical protein
LVLCLVRVEGKETIRYVSAKRIKLYSFAPLSVFKWLLYTRHTYLHYLSKPSLTRHLAMPCTTYVPQSMCVFIRLVSVIDAC